MRVLAHLVHPSSWMTLAGLLVALFGMVSDFRLAVICLVVAGLCDLADGPIARRMRRSSAQQAFGVQLDSLVDVVSFVILPASITFRFHAELGIGSLPLLIITPLYVVAGIARLASFNADADPTAARRHYSGLPVTYAALVLPVLTTLWVWFVRDPDQQRVLTMPALHPLGQWWTVAMAALAVAFVAPVKVPKPRGLAMAGLGVVAVVVLVTLTLVRL